MNVVHKLEKSNKKKKCQNKTVISGLLNVLNTFEYEKENKKKT